MKKKLPVVLTEEEETRLLKQFNSRYQTSHRNREMLRLALETGMRISEVLSLRWEEMEPEAGAVKIRVIDGKGKKDRTLFISPVMYDRLVKYAEKFNLQRTGLVFTTMKGTPVKSSYIRKMMRQKAASAEIEKLITFHSLRHTALTRLYSKTKNIRLVQEVAGHSDISTTMIYTHISGADIREAMILNSRGEK